MRLNMHIQATCLMLLYVLGANRTMQTSARAVVFTNCPLHVVGVVSGYGLRAQASADADALEDYPSHRQRINLGANQI